MSFEIKNNVKWVGKIDWDLRKFHGEELSTQHGSSYNSYLIKDEKNVLIDTVYTPFAEEFIQNLKKEIDLDKIDYIVINHAEPDHSGALPLLMQYAKNAKIICSNQGQKSIKGYYHQDWELNVMKSGDKLNIGSRELIFLENNLIHWPDSMMCYLTQDNILFSNDTFGQHFAHKHLLNSKTDSCVLNFEALKYYANILAPYTKRISKKVEELKNMNWQIDLICPSHGIMWDENPQQIIDLYEKWSNNYSENQITIVYDTMYQSTRKMAEAIATGINEANQNIEIMLLNAGTSDKSDIITEIFKSKVILVGSPTVNSGISTSLAGILDEISTFGFADKKGAAFGSYGWSPLGHKVLSNKLKEAGIEEIAEPLKVNWNPDLEALNISKEWGRTITLSLE